MNIDEAMETIAEAIAKGTIYDLNKAMVKPLKKAYGVEDLIFWTDQSNWFYCDFSLPKFDTYWRSDYNIDQFEELNIRLCGLKKGNSSVIFRGRRIESLNELKEEILIRKLSGILE